MHCASDLLKRVGRSVVFFVCFPLVFFPSPPSLLLALPLPHVQLGRLGFCALLFWHLLCSGWGPLAGFGVLSSVAASAFAADVLCLKGCTNRAVREPGPSCISVAWRRRLSYRDQAVMCNGHDTEEHL